MVETGVCDPSSFSWPDGSVRLLAWRIPTICWVETPDAASLVGSSVTARRSSRPPVRSTWATPSMPDSSGTISVRAISATSSRPPSVVDAIDETTTGVALMFRAEIVGSTPSGRPALAIPSWTAVVASLTSVPYENWAMTSEIELDEVDWSASSRGTPEMAFSTGFVTCSATSDEPDTRVRGDDGDDRELDVRQEFLLEAAPGRDPGDEQGGGQQQRDAALADGELTEATHWGLPWSVAAVDGWTGTGRPAAARRRAVASRRIWSARSTVSSSRRSDGREQGAELPGVELPEPLHQLEAGRRDGHDHLAAVVRVVGTDREALSDELVDEPARGGRRDPKPGDEFGHVDRPAGEHVEDLGLGHGDADVPEVGGVLEDEELHHLLVGEHHAFDEGRMVVGRSVVRVAWNVRYLRMVRCRRILSCRLTFVPGRPSRPSRTIGR